jgi:hypothetical protein
VKEVNGAQLYMGFFEDLGDVPFPHLVESPLLTVEDNEVEWILPADARKEMFGGGKGYWMFVTFSKDTLLHASPAFTRYYMSTGQPIFGPIGEERPEDLLSEETVTINFPSLFFNVVPEALSGP